MKITLDIPNEHAPRLLALLSDLMPVRLEPQADPAEGHPELPLSPFAPETLKNLRDIGSYNPPTTPDDESEAIAESAAGTVDQQLYRAFMAGAQAGKPGLVAKQIGVYMGDEVSLYPDDESEAIAETRWAPVQGIDAADPLKVEMEAEPVRDGDAELPFPEDFPALPPLPEGYSRWVYRGRFDTIACGIGTPCKERKVKYFNVFGWNDTESFDGPLHHIEAL